MSCKRGSAFVLLWRSLERRPLRLPSQWHGTLPWQRRLPGEGAIFAIGVNLAIFDRMMAIVPRGYGVTFTSVGTSVVYAAGIMGPLMAAFLTYEFGLAAALVVASAAGLAGALRFALDGRGPGASMARDEDPPDPDTGGEKHGGVDHSRLLPSNAAVNTPIPNRWRNEPGWRVAGSRPLDASKVQAPGVVRLPDGRFRLFYTAVGPAKPYPHCQGYILSAVSPDGLNFTVEDGIRLAPDPEVPWRSRRVLVPAVTALSDGGWRMYFESRGTAARPTVIASATSRDLLTWKVEDGIRLQKPGDIGGQRFVRLPDGRGRIYCFSRADRSVVSAITTDGLTFEWEPGERYRGGQTALESAGITAADVIPPARPGDAWTMLYSAWQDVPAGTVVPPHPSSDAALANRGDIDFAAASIAADMAGYRSRIFTATSSDGLTWQRHGLALEGDGYNGRDVGAVHAEDMSVIRLDDGRFRMYYAACDAQGVWRVASAISED